MALVKIYKDGSFLEYDQGKFDNWCVYYTNCKGQKSAPKDIDYFRYLYSLSQKYGSKRLYSDYIKLYDRTTKDLEKEVLLLIEEIARGYELIDDLTVDKVFTTLYMGMIAEEKKANTKLGKRIKRLGVHALLVNQKSVEEAATFMTGKNWRELDSLCKEGGF